MRIERHRALWALGLLVAMLGLVGPSLAQSVVDDFADGSVDPAWTLVGIGNANQESVREIGGVLELTADGSTAFSAADNGGFVYREVTGDFRAEVTIDGTGMTTGGQYRKAGLMVRGDLNPWAPRVLHLLAPYWQNGNQTRLQSVIRETQGGSGRLPLNQDTIGVPRVLRLAVQRVGDVVTVEHSTDGGATWIQATSGLGGQVAMPALPSTVTVGLAVVSNDISTTSTAVFDDFFLTGDVTMPLGSLQITAAEPDVDQRTLRISGVALGDAVFTGVVTLDLPLIGPVVLSVLDYDPVARQVLVELPNLSGLTGTFTLTVDDGPDRVDSLDLAIGSSEAARIAALESAVAALIARVQALESGGTSGGGDRLPTTPLLVVDRVETRTTTAATSTVRLVDIPGTPTHVDASGRCTVLGNNASGHSRLEFYDAAGQLVLDYQLCSLGGVSKGESTSVTISHIVPIPEGTARFEISTWLSGIRLPGTTHSVARADVTVLGDP